MIEQGRFQKETLVMDSPHQRPHVRHDSAFLESIERRDMGRHNNFGEFVMFWHHDPAELCRYITLDLSNTGARLRTNTPLPEGMTGVAMTARSCDEQIERIVMVVWSRSIRDADGNTSHHEAGLRFI
jgi:hypothetical protein